MGRRCLEPDRPRSETESGPRVFAPSRSREDLFYKPGGGRKVKRTGPTLSWPWNPAMIANLILMGPTDLCPALDSLDRPVMFVFSSGDRAISQAEKVRNHSPRFRVEVFEDTAHALHVDKPERFNRVLEEFLIELPD